MRAPYKSLGPTVYNNRNKKENHCNTEQNNNLRKLTPSFVPTKEPNICKNILTHKHINSFQNILTIHMNIRNKNNTRK
jgi:hypothetical protein